MIDIIKTLKEEEKNGILHKKINNNINTSENNKHKYTRYKTSKNKSENILVDNKRLLEIVFDKISDGISVLNNDLTIVKTNQFMKNNYSKNNPIEGKKCFQIYQKRSTPCPWCPTLKALETCQTQTVTVPYPSEDDPKGWFLISSYPMIVENKTIGVIEHVKDVTKFKKSEKSLMKSKQILNQLVENTNQVFYTHDKNHIITYISPKCKKMFGYDADEIKIKWTSLTTDHPMNKKGYSYTEKAIKTGEKQDIYNLELRKKNGTSFIVEVNESPIKDDDGQVIGIIGSLSDVTEKIIAEKKLNEKIQTLETFHDIGIQRELKLIQLKKEINSLCTKYGEPTRYNVKDETEITI